jgi:NADH-quinone oxidoreductase subunit F
MVTTDVPDVSDAPDAPDAPDVPDAPDDELDALIHAYPADRHYALAVLQDMQRRYNYVPRAGIERLATWLNAPEVQVYALATFYKALSLKPKGRHIIKVCDGTACHISNSASLIDSLQQILGIGPDEVTADGEFSLETVNCLGSCAVAPVLLIDDVHYGKMTPERVAHVIEQVRAGVADERTQGDAQGDAQGAVKCAATSAAPRLQAADAPSVAPRHTLEVCCGTGCIAGGARAVLGALQGAAADQGRAVEVLAKVKPTGCHGLCQEGPVVRVLPDDISYYRVQPDDAPAILASLDSEPVSRLLFKAADKSRVLRTADNPFYRHQVKVALRNVGHIDPTSLDDYLAVGGYRALRKALGMTPQQIINEVTRSGLRGRGGAGFLTGRKWQGAADEPQQPHYVVCNGDEGDPGAFMDGYIMEGDPHSVLEGLAIAALATGAEEGYLYLRDEYLVALAHIRTALADAEAAGLLGDDVCGSGRRLSLSVVRGGGAFVCGESSALMASIEGRVGEPRSKYIRSVQKGLWEKPTVLNNVETLATVPVVIDCGAEYLAALGTETSKGTKAFAMVGKVRYGGLVEVPMGVTLRQLVFDIGGGTAGGRPFKAVQTGGPSGGCLPADLLDVPVDYESLVEHGSMVGSGGMIVMDDRNCMVDVARYYIGFLAGESCGKCTPCREGLRHMHAILTRIVQGEGQPQDLDRLEELCFTLEEAALCALGTTAVNPVRSTIRYFRDEYLAHVNEGVCPAGVCPQLTVFAIDEEACSSCGACLRACPAGCITKREGADGSEGKAVFSVDASRCTGCGSCRNACRFEAVMSQKRLQPARAKAAPRASVGEEAMHA